MSATEVAEQTGNESTAIRPFQVSFPEARARGAAQAHRRDEVARARDG